MISDQTCQSQNLHRNLHKRDFPRTPNFSLHHGRPSSLSSESSSDTLDSSAAPGKPSRSSEDSTRPSCSLGLNVNIITIFTSAKEDWLPSELSNHTRVTTTMRRHISTDDILLLVASGSSPASGSLELAALGANERLGVGVGDSGSSEVLDGLTLLAGT